MDSFKEIVNNMVITPSDILIYYLSWMIPSGTFVYIILHEKLKLGRISSYVISGIVAGTIMFPIQNYVFGH